MRKYLFSMLALAISFTQLASVQAGAISQLVFGTVNELEDDNFEVFFKTALGDVNTVEVGDRFLGTIRIQQFLAPPNSFPPTYVPGVNDPTITAIFALEAAAIENVAIGGPLPNRTNVYFKPLGTTDWDTAFGITGFNPDNANTIAQFYDDVSASDLSIANPLQSALGSFKGLNKVFEAGFKGSAVGFNGGLTDAGEFFVATGALGTDEIGVDLGSILNILNLNVIQSYGSVTLEPHNFLATDGVAQPRALGAGVSFNVAADLQGAGTIASTNNSGAFPINTDTDLYIRPVPEPSSLAIFAFGAIGAGVSSLRRRRRQLA